MDKGRHPHVVRTWTVERTRVPVRMPQTPKLRVNSLQEHFHPPAIKPHGETPKKGVA